ncbi:MAG: hypothetical protein IPM58_05760 [Nitrospira sp.]|nr:hypothetical protein [Nitrospira sp.]
MPKKLTSVRKRPRVRNWIAYTCEALVASGAMPTWEAATYLTENLFGEKPNPRLLTPSNPHEVTAQLLHRLYEPILEAAARDAGLPAASTVHIFTDISLTGHSAVLVVLFHERDQPQTLVMLDAVKAWDLVFQDAESFNLWAEERYKQLVDALRSAIVDLGVDVLKPAV